MFDILVQTSRDKKAAKKFSRRLLRQELAEFNEEAVRMIDEVLEKLSISRSATS